jgi:hypothetical protein
MGNSHGRIITIIVSSILIVLVVISLIPFNTVACQIMETYYEAETKQEPYAARESYTVQESVKKQQTIFDAKPFSVPFGTNVPVLIDKPGSELIGHFELPGSGAIRILLPSNRIFYEQLGKRGDFTIALSEGGYTVVLRDSRIWGEPVYLNLVVTWTEEAEVTKYREVTKNRDIVVQIKKQRPITVYKKASWWEMIFGISPQK